MKKTLLKSLLVLIIAFSLFPTFRPVSAACSSFFTIMTEAEEPGYINVDSCTPSSQQIDGLSIDVENNKITLNNYNGGAIYYSCRGTCEDTKSMEIELIGQNTITAKTYNPSFEEDNITQYSAIINIIPSFTGNGTLTINAEKPINFDQYAINGEHFSSISIMGSDYEKSAIEPETQEEQSQQTIKNDPSFFNTTPGKILLITIPSLLIVIIIILLIALLKKNKDNNSKETINNVEPNQQI